MSRKANKFALDGEHPASDGDGHMPRQAVERTGSLHPTTRRKERPRGDLTGSESRRGATPQGGLKRAITARSGRITRPLSHNQGRRRRPKKNAV